MNPSFIQKRTPALQLPLSTSVSVCLSGMITMAPRCFRDKYENTVLNSKRMQSVKVNLHRGRGLGFHMQVWIRWHQQEIHTEVRNITHLFKISFDNKNGGTPPQTPWVLKVNWSKGYFVDQAVHREYRRRGCLLFHYTGISRICKSSLAKTRRLKQSQTLVSFTLLRGFWDLASHKQALFHNRRKQT